ncbi:PKD domain-containing protein [Haloprofundus halophilus]|uniref:PKD domain-containing protein n=1 Tax=Haloprofundus halophilus TaxID=2283527 RepID=UPI00130051F2|nr:PKD domain-containing protein [Haloprofundus halophilus]
MTIRRLFVALLVVSATAPVHVVGTSSEPPLADAGLDQTVERGSTVLLDGTGSRDPDGTLEAYRWSIRGPDGRTVVPENESAPRTSFVPDMVGRFNVTLTVTDDDGTTSSDTLYVTVEPGDAPSVDLTGPEDGFVGQDQRFTVEITPGSAPLDRAVWRVDGAVVSRRSLSPDARTDTLEMPFGSTGSQDVSVTVVDADDRSNTDSKSVQISSQGPAGADETTAPPGLDSDPAIVRGDRVVTGERPLEGSYRIDAPSFTNVADVEWYSERGLVGHGHRLRQRWEPGSHTLYAVIHYQDGYRSVARFEDGETSVVADPRPNASVTGLSLDHGTVSGTAVGSDEFGNLRAMTVSLDGRQVVSWTDSGSGVSQNDLSFEANATPNEEHRLRVTAIDARGQERVFSRTITPTGSPEIVSSQFLNTPVDSYHERIDPERYIAYHEMKIDLNGADPEDVSWRLKPKKENSVLVLDSHSKNESGVLVIESRIAGRYPGSYVVNSEIWSNNGPKLDTFEESSNKFKVEQSPPELRVNISYNNEKRVNGDRPVTVDATDSFDPDYTTIRYKWRNDMDPVLDGTHLTSHTDLGSMRVTIIDGYGNSITETTGLEGYYTPKIADVSISDRKEIYLPNETVRLEVVSEEYTRIGDPNPLNIHAETTGHEAATITDWSRDAGFVHDNYDGEYRWSGIIELPASALQSGKNNPSIQIYNAENPDITIRSEKLPSVTVYKTTNTQLTNTSVNNLRYTVLNEEYDWRQATDYTTLQRYRNDGYVVDSTDRRGIEYNVQQYKKTQSAKYRTEKRHFERYDSRELLLDANSDWVSAGSETTTDVWHTTETEWRDNRAGKGTFTGDTRTVRVEPARYRTEKQYEYDRRVRKTGTRRVTETRTRTTTDVRERTVTRCTQWGCFESTERYTVTDRETYTVTTTETYSYYTTETETYWSTQPFGSDHRHTGNVRRVQTAPAEYERQYQYEYRERHEETTTTYIAEKREQVRPAQYDWVHYETTTSGPRVDQITRRDGFRVGSTSKIRRWFMKKKIGESKETSDTYDDADDVIRTRGTVTGEIRQTFMNPVTGETTTQITGEFKEEFIKSGSYTKSEVFDEITSSKSNAECGKCGGVI